MSPLKVFTAFLFCCFTSILVAQISINSKDSIYEIGEGVEFIITPEDRVADINEVINFQDRSINSDRFFSRGISKNTFWLFLSIKNNSTDSLFYLESGNVDLNEIGLYEITNYNVKDSCVINRQSSFEEMPVDFSYYVFPVKINPGETKQLVVKVNSDWPISLPLKVGSERVMNRSFLKFDLSMAFFAGVIMVFILLSVVVFIYDRSSSYLYYALYLTVYLALQVTVLGYGHRLIWTSSREVNGIMNVLLTSGSAVFLIQFVRKFFITKRFSKIIDVLYISLIFIFIVNALLTITLETPSVFSYVLNGAMITFTIISLFLAFKNVSKRFKPARYFALGFSVFFIAIILYALSNLGVLAYHPGYFYLTLVGSLFQFTMMGAALISRFQFFESEKKQFRMAQQEHLKSEVQKQTQEISDKLAVIDRQKKEKEVMLKEIHHRVKNNFQIINSLLRLQSYEIKDESSRKAFEEAQQRILSMAMVHERMYGSNSLASIHIEEYILGLVSEIRNNYADNNIEFEYDIDDFLIGIKTAVPLGLLVNELITNSIKHAFDNMSGKISINVKCFDDNFKIEIIDNGVGFKENFKSTGIGMELVEAFVEQLDGELTRFDMNPGTKFEVIVDNGKQHNKEELEPLEEYRPS